MTLTNTNKQEVLFEELCQEDTANITGGVSISSSASAQISNPAQTSVSAQIVNPTPTNIPKELTGNESINDLIGKFLNPAGVSYTVNTSKDGLSIALQVSGNVS